MICHAKRIAETQRINEMEFKLTPLIAAVSIALLLGMISFVSNIYDNYQSAQNDSTAFVACLNGQAISADDAIVTCTVQRFSLVKGIK